MGNDFPVHSAFSGGSVCLCVYISMFILLINSCCRKHDSCYGRVNCYFGAQFVPFGSSCNATTQECQCTGKVIISFPLNYCRQVFLCASNFIPREESVSIASCTCTCKATKWNCPSDKTVPQHVGVAK